MQIVKLGEGHVLAIPPNIDRYMMCAIFLFVCQVVWLSKQAKTIDRQTDRQTHRRGRSKAKWAFKQNQFVCMCYVRVCASGHQIVQRHAGHLVRLAIFSVGPN